MLGADAGWADAFVGVDDDGDHLEVVWHWAWTRPHPRATGMIGWATVLQTTNPSKGAVSSVVRIHKCAHNPCQARLHKSA